MNDYIIETRELSKSYGNILALNQVSIHVKKGSIYGLVGDNGAGKSTLLKLLVGHIYPTNGELSLFHKQSEQEMCKERKRTGTMIEHTGFFPNLTVSQTLEYYRIQRGIPGKVIINDVLKSVDLEEKRNSKCKNLSLGQKQRLGLAIALIGEPELLILDEPINGLDPSGIIEFRNLLLKLNKQKNMTILLSSHILTELEQLATDYGFLSKGQLVEEITATSLFDKCKDIIEIQVSDTPTYTALLDRHLANEQYKVMPDNSIRIFNPKYPLEDYSKLAANNQIYILGLGKKQTSLEEYYMRIKNGGTQS